MAEKLKEVTSEELELAKAAIGAALVGLEDKGIREGNTLVDLLIDMKGQLDGLSQKIEKESIERKDLEKNIRTILEIAAEADAGPAAGRSEHGILARLYTGLDRFFAENFGASGSADGSDGGSPGPPDPGKE